MEKQKNWTNRQLIAGSLSEAVFYQLYKKNQSVSIQKTKVDDLLSLLSCFELITNFENPIEKTRNPITSFFLSILS